MPCGLWLPITESRAPTWNSPGSCMRTSSTAAFSERGWIVAPSYQAYLRAMAELGPEPQLASAVARFLNRTSEQCGPTRSGLIDKGLLYTPNHGYAAFTVPHFDQFMRRSVPALSVPPVRQRRKGSRRRD
jgi:hypothetical protein